MECLWTPFSRSGRETMLIDGRPGDREASPKKSSVERPPPPFGSVAAVSEEVVTCHSCPDPLRAFRTAVADAKVTLSRTALKSDGSSELREPALCLRVHCTSKSGDVHVRLVRVE